MSGSASGRTFEIRLTGTVTELQRALQQAEASAAAAAGSVEQGMGRAGASLGQAGRAGTQMGQQVEAGARAAEAASRRAQASAAALASANDNAARSSGGFGAALGQAGFQVQDFATQVSMGQNALVAFGVQFAQFAGFFGTAGAIAGAVVTVGVIAAQLLTTADATEQLNDAVKAQGDLYRATLEASERYRTGLQQQAEDLNRLRDLYQTYTAERQRAETQRLLDRETQLATAGAALQSQALGALPQVPQNILDLVGSRAMRGQPFGGAQDGLAEPVLAMIRALGEFRAQSQPTAESAARLATQLQDIAASIGGGLSPALLDSARRLRDMIPALEEHARAVAQNAAQQEAQRAAANGAGAALGGAATEAGRLADELRRIARAAAEDPLADITRDAGRLQAQLVALRRGGLAGLEAERNAQAITRAGEEAQAAMLREQRDLLGRPDSGVAPADVEARAQAAAAAARLAGEERERQRQQLEAEIAAARDAARPGRSPAAPRAGATPVDRDAQEAARFWDQTRTAAERYEATLTRLGELRPTLERLYGADGANEVIARQTERALADLERMEAVTKNIQDQASATNGVANDLGLTFGSAFEDAIVKGATFSDILKGIEEDLLRIGTRRLVTEPLVNGLTSLFSVAAGSFGFGGPGGAEILGALGPLKSANGNAFDASGLIPFANGGVVNRPTIFPFAGGTGLMGEAGAEAIMPLKRGRDGKLGVAAQGGGGGVVVQMTVNTPDAGSFRRSESQILADLHRGIARGRRNV